MTDPFLEPFRIKMVERVRRTTRAERQQILEDAGYNLFQVPADDVLIDLLTDSGTGAMSSEQWSRMMLGDESYAGARSFYAFQEAVQEITGFPYVLPTHQGRGAENVLFGAAVQPGQTVPNNSHFDTTQANLLARQGRPLDFAVPEAWNPSSRSPFKGNMDVPRLREFLAREHTRVPLGMSTITNNSAAGQPVSMENLRDTAAAYHEHGIPFILDAARFAENAWFIRQREPGYSGRCVREIVAEMFGHADGCVMSAKKDAIVNIGGFIALRDAGLFARCRQQLVLREGFPTYGGLTGRDLEALAQGLYEGVDEEYLEYRTAQVAYLAAEMHDAGVPVYLPAGGHAVYVDAGRLLPHIPPSQFPGVSLANALYVEGGVRTVEIGSLMFEQTDPETGATQHPALELVRFAIPRRTYTRSHMDYVAERTAAVARSASTLRGLRIQEAPELLRHFLARLAPVS